MRRILWKLSRRTAMRIQAEMRAELEMLLKEQHNTLEYQCLRQALYACENIESMPMYEDRWWEPLYYAGFAQAYLNSALKSMRERKAAA